METEASSFSGGYVDFWELLSDVQQYISRNCAALLGNDPDNLLKPYIDQYIRSRGCTARGMTRDELVASLYNEMAGYSVLTRYLESDDLEEINVNGWDDIALTFTNGKIVKAPERFHSPGHAEDIVRRLLRNSGMILDNAMPVSQGHLPGNNRITALKTPLVDSDRGVCVSIRLLHNSKIGLEQIVSGGMGSPEMIAFLRLLCRFGVSFVIAGPTSSGKTTLLNAILSDMPDNKRIFTIESGARELSLVRRDEGGRVLNNAVHTISRPSDNPSQNIIQEDLVVASLRFNPDIVCVGEMRDTECYAAVEAAMTGHTVVSTVHSGAADAAHMRIALLCQKKFPMDFQVSMMQAARAFPVVVYCGRLEDNKRRIMDISECVFQSSDLYGKYSSLFSFESDNVPGGGRFVCGSAISDRLRHMLREHGAPESELRQFRFEGKR